MKILVISHDSSFRGGANKSLFTVIKMLKEKFGVEIEVLMPRRKGEFQTVLANIGVQTYNSRYFVTISELHNNPKDYLRRLKVLALYIYDLFLSKLLEHKFKEQQYDLVYTNTRVVTIGALLSKKMRIPHVTHVREFGPEQPLWGFWNHKKIYKLSDKIILISKALEKTFSDCVPNDKLITIYNGIDTPFTNKKKGFNKRLNLLISGSLAKTKGQLDAIKSLGHLKENEWCEGVKLFIAGSAPQNKQFQKYKIQMVETIQKLNLEENIVFLGEVSDMGTLRAKMDVELICSKEGFGRVTVEAMRSRLLAIGANVGATPEIIENGVTGLLYEHGNYKDLADKIKFVHENRERAEAIALYGRIFSESNFTIEKNVKEILEIFKSVLLSRNEK